MLHEMHLEHVKAICTIVLDVSGLHYIKMHVNNAMFYFYASSCLISARRHTNTGLSRWITGVLERKRIVSPSLFVSFPVDNVNVRALVR